MRKSLRLPGCTFVVWLAIALGMAAAAPADEELRVRIERVAKDCQVFVTGDFLYDRPLFRPASPEQREAQAKLTAELMALKGDRKGLSALLKHPDPEVRTLALLALFLREEGRDLPLIASLQEDRAETFPTLDFSNSAPVSKAPEKRQTVGDVARSMIGFYLSAADWQGQKATFAAYWEQREHREHCASWFAVKMLRATLGELPIPKQRKAEIAGVLAEIDALPPTERAWTHLFVLASNQMQAADRIVPESDVVASSRGLGPTTLLDFLERKPIYDDPDFQSGHGDPGAFPHLAGFVLRHAGELLRPEDADALLTCETNERAAHDIRSLATPLWPIAAADLQPDRAGEILHAALERFHGHDVTSLFAALWRSRGLAEKDFRIEQFYTTEPERGRFLAEITRAARKDSREFLTALLSDPRFELTDRETLAGMLRVASLGHETPLVGERDLYDTAHSTSMAATLAGWRNLLRQECGLAAKEPTPIPKPRKIITEPGFSAPLEEMPSQIAFSPDGRYFAAVAKGTVKVWEAAAGKEVWALSNRSRTAALAFREAGPRLVLLDNEGRRAEWDFATGKSVADAGYRGRPDQGIGGPAAFDRAITRIGVVDINWISAFAASDGHVLWNQRSERYSRLGALSADGGWLAAVGNGPIVSLFDAADGTLVREIHADAGVSVIAFPPDAETLVIGTGDNGLSWYELATGALRKRVPYPVSGPGAYSADGKWLAVGSPVVEMGQYRAGIFDAATGELRWEIRGKSDNRTTALALSPDGAQLVVGGLDWKRLDVWRLERGRE